MVVLGTYNMSWASDAFKNVSNEELQKRITNGDQKGVSEMTFMHRDPGANDGRTERTFWTNALNHLKQFIIDHKPLAVGLQEMNLTEKDSGTGTDAVKKMLSELGEEYSYKLYCKSKGTPFNTEPALCLIVNEKEENIVFGEEENIKIAKDDSDTNETFRIVDNPTQKGRPILMALTDEGTLLVNMHGAQNPGLGKKPNEFSDYMREKNKEKLEMLVEEFVGTKKVDKAYIMGDFNDRYDAITKFNFEFGDNKVVANYEGESPASCCHNFDSMGKEKYKLPYGDFYQGKDDKDYKEANITIPPDHGITVDDYLNKGDKVFAYPKSGELKIYTCEHNLDKERVSKASDHELVYMEITDTDVEPAAEPAAPEAEPAAPEAKTSEEKDSVPPVAPPQESRDTIEPTAEPTESTEAEGAVGGKKYKRKTAKRVSKSKNNKSKKGGKKTKKNNSKKAKNNKSKKSKK